MYRFRSSAGVGLAGALGVAALVVPSVGAAGQSDSKQGAMLPYQDARLPVQRRVDDLLSRMTLAEKIGQMTQAERQEVEKSGTAVITKDNLGSLLSGGGSVPTPNAPS